MKIEMIAVDLAVVASVVVPYLILIFAGKISSNGLKKQFEAEALKLDLLPSLQHTWNSNKYGLDKSRKKLLFVRKVKDIFQAEVIDLLQLRGCRLEIESAEKGLQKNLEAHLQRIDLELTYISGEKKILNLFDFDLSPLQDYELENAQKLEFLIRENLQEQSFFKRSA